MLGFLFRSLTADTSRGAPLFDAVTAIARRPHWYVEGRVPDTIDGRFAVLSSVTALVLVRLERAGEDGDAVSVALTERFIEVMEAEHRELGLGDPTLGKTVRKLVGSLAKRTELWRTATADGDWLAAIRDSLRLDDAEQGAVEHDAQALRALWDELKSADVSDLARGKLQ